jgi:hypothetical protein
MTSMYRSALIPEGPFWLGGLEIRVIDAQKQARTARDVKGPWVRPKVPSKLAGRKGTRKGWKRRNPPHHIMLYREPDDVLVLHDRIVIATERQYQAIRESTKPRPAYPHIGMVEAYA